MLHNTPKMPSQGYSTKDILVWLASNEVDPNATLPKEADSFIKELAASFIEEGRLHDSLDAMAAETGDISHLQTIIIELGRAIQAGAKKTPEYDALQEQLTQYSLSRSRYLKELEESHKKRTVRLQELVKNISKAPDPEAYMQSEAFTQEVQRIEEETNQSKQKVKKLMDTVKKSQTDALHQYWASYKPETLLRHPSTLVVPGTVLKVR